MARFGSNMYAGNARPLCWRCIELCSSAFFAEIRLSYDEELLASSAHKESG